MFAYEQSFRKLIVWQEAKKLCLLIYKFTRNFPKEEVFGITSQMRRSAQSVMANIAEGNARTGKKDRQNFFMISKSSLVELDNFLDLSLDLGYVSEKEYADISEILNKTAYLLKKFSLSQS